LQKILFNYTVHVANIDPRSNTNWRARPFALEKKMNHIELFAGCGGLSLGLESAGFELLLANELSPMAGETFAYNFFGQDLAGIAKGEPAKTTGPGAKWLSSHFSVGQMAERLRENPRLYPPLGQRESDIKSAADLEKGSLVVGSIVQFNEWLSGNRDARALLKDGFGAGGVDLVSGGPPCQSFSMAGAREYGNDRNVLPMEFANFVGMVKPKMALLENVTGILRPFTVDGKKIHAWFEVAKAFAAEGYVPLCLHINAKFAGVAQNRPRFLMFLFRKDIFKAILPSLNEAEKELMLPSGVFFRNVTENPLIEYEVGGLPYFDVKDAVNVARFSASFLKPLVAFSGDRKPYTVRDAIDDLKKDGGACSDYVDELNAHFNKHVHEHEKKKKQETELEQGPENHEKRNNNALVTRRFRIYQVLQGMPRGVQTEVQALLAGTASDISTDSTVKLCEHWFVGENGKRCLFDRRRKQALVEYLRSHPTKKQTQKALDPDAPAPAALSIPDDACHYLDLRTLSVREMARIQSFPDKFEFRSKVTTGGQMRKFEVPQYTQVGNAVPPVLGRALGFVFKDLIERTNAVPAAKRKASAVKLAECV
jgi:DNA (cytosine-5)-methyltransferase 1